MSISYYPVPSSSIRYSTFKKDAKAGKLKGCRFKTMEKGTYVPRATDRAFSLYDTKDNWLVIHELDSQGNVELTNYQLGNNDSSSIIARILSYYKCKAYYEGDETTTFSASDFRGKG